ncbi:MAG: ATP-dependent DNA helicase RecG [Patescibacteria group bacterium]
MNLNTPVSQLNKIGQITAKKLTKLGINTVEDLLYHFPFRYEDWSKILTIAELKSKKSGTVRGKINLIANHRSPRKRMIITEAIVSDKTDSIKVVWFNQPFLITALRPGTEVYLAGKIDYDENYGLEFLNPSYEFATNKAPIHTGRLVPVYPTTTNLSQKQIRSLIRQVLPLTQAIEDWLPREIKIAYNLPSLTIALEQIHFPSDKKWLDRCLHRLKFDELFLIQLQNQIIRQEIKKQKAPSIKFKLKETQKFTEDLPFKLTEAQRIAAWEILKDLEKPRPMNRLLEGDVGSGKTVVAMVAILNVFLNDYQTVYLAPTEILAHQHYETFNKFFKNWPIKIALLTRSEQIFEQKKMKKEDILTKIKNREIDLIVGTHALLQEKVKFANLALVIIDEQHRFGVEQRAALASQTNTDKIQTKTDEKGLCRPESMFWPHFLSMTATPIPRSLALTLYGDLDLSIIDKMPSGRKQIISKIVRSNEMEETYQFIRQQIKQGRQAFVICPLIDPSDRLGVKSVKEEYKKLKEKIFPDLNIGLLHGRLKAKEKDKIMADFLANKINILVSTTVVEVGVDVPNTSIMMIEGAERFGLAQLYQLKGRVGRSIYQSYCFLFAENPGPKTYQRLKALLTAKNGFELAEKDLEMRGPGEIFGTTQSGYLNTLKIAKLSDSQIIKEAQEAATKIISEDPDLKKYPNLKKKIKQLTKITHLE